MSGLHPLIDWLFNLRGPSLKWELDTAKAFSAWLGHPEREPAFVHVSGTNGKGSVAATIHAIAQAADLRAGLFTSPHLVCPTERIRVGESSIDQERFLARIEWLKAEADRALETGAIPRYPSFFEMMTAAAFLQAPMHLPALDRVPRDVPQSRPTPHDHARHLGRGLQR